MYLYCKYTDMQYLHHKRIREKWTFRKANHNQIPNSPLNTRITYNNHNTKIIKNILYYRIQ